MPVAWESEDIRQHFSDIIYGALLGLRNDLWIATGHGVKTRIVEIKNEITKCKKFSAKCKNVTNEICLNGNTPAGAGLIRTTDSTGPVFNFYEHGQFDWVAYFHIDIKFRKSTAVFAYHNSQAAPSPLRETLIGIMEEFRENP